jgi:RNA polymerase sigma-70 factor, ECF subfamily
VNSTEAELIERAQAGETEAFGLLAEGFERQVYGLALHYCRNAQDAEDLAQEVWLKAYRSLGTFRGEASFYTWLRRIMINCFLNHLRTTSFRWRGQEIRAEVVPTDARGFDDRPSVQNPEATLHQKLLANRVMEALSELTAQQRLIFLLKHNEGMTYEEISRELGCSTGTVKKSLFRAVAKLRIHLDVNAESANYVPCAAN